MIRTWWNALGLVELDRYSGRRGIVTRWVLRAIGEAAMKSGSRYVAFGVRSLSIATGVDHTTVAWHLRLLRDEDDPLIELIENDRGLAGDLYELRIPRAIAERASTSSWKAGKLWALRPVFRELGHTAALVYEALECTRLGGRTSFDLSAATGLSRSAVYDALETLAAWDLIGKCGGRWSVAGTAMLQVRAEQFGCLEDIRGLVSHHRIERAAYRRAMHVEPQIVIAANPWLPLSEEPPPEELTVLDLLQRELGAYVVQT